MSGKSRKTEVKKKQESRGKTMKKFFLEIQSDAVTKWRCDEVKSGPAYHPGKAKTSLRPLRLKGRRKKQDTIPKKNVRVQRRFITKNQEKNDK